MKNASLNVFPDLPANQPVPEAADLWHGIADAVEPLLVPWPCHLEYHSSLDQLPPGWGETEPPDPH